MIKVLKALGGVAVLTGAAMVLAPLSAAAKCEDCNQPVSSTKVSTRYQHKTVQKVNNVTRYRDVNNTRYVTHTKRIVNVTRIQPVTRVNVVTRVHNRTKILHENQNVAQTRMLPARTETTSGGTQHISHGGETSKVSTVYRYKTVQKVNNVTQYKDVDRTRYVKHVNRLVTVTSVQPITRVHLVTRVHNRTVVRNRTENIAQTAMLPTRTITTAKTIQINHKPINASCGC
ncbi:MAG TPA: hypothetical protein VG966_03525 [Hyphomicrobiaceae bacterium]|nr:hypothetical protein [Hyphomicrobiaceae bacterium]